MDPGGLATPTFTTPVATARLEGTKDPDQRRYGYGGHRKVLRRP